MSYPRLPAGHTGAPHITPVVACEDEDIEALVRHLTPMSEMVFPTVADAFEYCAVFFRDRKPWPQERIYRAAADKRLQHTLSIPDYFNASVPLPAFFVPPALDSCIDRVLLQNDVTRTVFPFSQLHYQAHRIFVLTREQATDERIGENTSHALYVLMGRAPSIPRQSISSSNSVVVNLRTGSDSIARSQYLELSSVVWYFENAHRTLIHSDSGRDRFRWLPHHLEKQPELEKYLTTLAQHCEDPRTLHDYYGFAPGPNICNRLYMLTKTSRWEPGVRV